MAPLPDVFRNPFQTAPLDLGTDAFYPSRREAIDQRLQVNILPAFGWEVDFIVYKSEKSSAEPPQGEKPQYCSWKGVAVGMGDAWVMPFFLDEWGSLVSLVPCVVRFWTYKPTLPLTSSPVSPTRSLMFRCLSVSKHAGSG